MSSMGPRRPSSSFNKDTAVFHPSDFWGMVQERLMAIGFLGSPQRRKVWGGVQRCLWHGKENWKHPGVRQKKQKVEGEKYWAEKEECGREGLLG